MAAEAGYLTGRIDAVREHILSLVAAAPQLPEQFGHVIGQIEADWEAHGRGTTLTLIVAFALVGFVVEWGYRHAFRRRPVDDSSVLARLRSIGLQVARDLGAVAAFALGSVASFLVLDWPARTQEGVVGFLAGFIGLRVVLVASRALASPDDARLRLVPASDAEAAHWHRRLALFAGWFAFGWVLLGWLALLGMNLPTRQLVAYTLGIGLLAIAGEAFWHRSRLAVAYFALLWLLWAARATGFLWLAMVAGALPLAMRLAQRAADHALREPGAPADAPRSVPAAAVGRALRAALIIGAAFVLLRAFGLDVEALAADSVWMRLARGAVQALAVILVADVLWMVSAALIDKALAQARSAEPAADAYEANRRARLRTLLPIMRGTVAVVLFTMVVLMTLSALGIEVAPLLAGAGVVGVAIGFGAQTLVRDIFSKFFYLLDDAFRVGEYIQSGSYKGTVEHLGARSIRLRHHRGPVYTVPYGQLGAVQNMSRDWVIDKLTVNLTYDVDLDKARKLIKKIGQELAKDPDFAPNILEPLKMQGVEQFGDFAIQIRMKMKTRPGEQFGVRRRAYAMIRAAFAENGIRFAHPTVQVAGQGDNAAAAAAQRTIAAIQSKGEP